MGRSIAALAAGDRNGHGRGRIKLALDGSIQGYAAYLSKPHHLPPKGAVAVEPDACNSDAGARMLLGAGAGSPVAIGGAAGDECDLLSPGRG